MLVKIAWAIWAIILFVKWNNYFQQNAVQLNEIRQLKQYVQILEETIVYKSLPVEHIKSIEPTIMVEPTIMADPTIMVVLGCAMPELQQDRIQRALEFAEKKSDEPIIWFLTGGVKDALVGATEKQSTEASSMAKTIGTNRENIVLDEKAKNTAENFANLKEYLSTNTVLTNNEHVSVVVTTSEFHQARASKIFEGVFHDILDKVDVTWNVSGGACQTCWADERIHMRNVEADVMRALVK